MRRRGLARTRYFDRLSTSFEERTGGLWLIFRKDILTEEYLRTLGLNERQIKAMLYVKEKARITNLEYQRLCQISKRTASDELGALEAKGLLERVGTRGKGTYYQLRMQQKGEMGNKWAPKGQSAN